jgi:hydroxymethylbilane synthase
LTGAGRSRHNDSERIRFESNYTTQKLPAKLIIASRESRLAMWQASTCATVWRHYIRSAKSDILGMTTRGDQILDRTLSKVGGKGLFVKELEVAMAEGRADLAVHSLKDVPMDLPEGFELAPCSSAKTRATPSSRTTTPAWPTCRPARGRHQQPAPPGPDRGALSAAGGQAAARQSRHPPWQARPRRLRGHHPGRRRPQAPGPAAAHPRLLDDPEDSLPAAGQGAMAIEIASGERSDGVDLRALLAPLNHEPTAQAVRAERKVSRCLRRQLPDPAGGPRHRRRRGMHLRAMVGHARRHAAGPRRAVRPGGAAGSAGRAGVEAAEQQDAAAILAECKAEAAAADAADA